MPIFKYYNPYRRPNFYNYYRPNYSTNYVPIFPSRSTLNYPTQSEPSNIQATEESSSTKQNRSTPKSDDNVWLDLFGIKLYFDDVLILSLLFFLYKEVVKDEGLFLALVLLLIS